MMKMKKLSEDHYIIMDDSEIKEGDFFLMNSAIIRQCDYIDGYMLIDTTQGKHHISVCDKITHSTQPLNTNFNDWFDVQIITLSEVKELLGVVDVHKKALTFTKEIGGTHEQGLAFIDGYYQALEDNKERKYTNKDIVTAIAFGFSICRKENRAPFDIEQIQFIQSLQPAEWEVEFIDGKLKLKS